LGKQRKAPWLTKENNIGEMADNVGLTDLFPGRKNGRVCYAAPAVF